MDGEILYLFLKFEFEEFYKKSGFEIRYNKECREIYLFILKYDDNREKINVLEYEELATERKKQFRTSYCKYQEFINFERNLFYKIDPKYLSVFLEDSLIASNIAHVISKSIADRPVVLIKWQEKFDRANIIACFKSIGAKIYFDKMFLLSDTDELLKWTKLMKDMEVLDAFISTIKIIKE